MRKITKKILLILLIAFSSFSLLGCAKKEKADNLLFNNLLDSIVVDIVGEDPINVNYYFKYPEKYGLTNLSVSAYIFLEEDETLHYEYLKELKTTVLEFEDDSLSKSQILTKKIVLDYLDRLLLLENFIGYSTSLNAELGFQLTFPSNLADYRFDDLGDINNYFDYIRNLRETFENMISYETLRSNNNRGLTDAEIDQIVGQCEDFINEEEVFLIEIFNEKVDGLSFLSAEEKISLKEENKNLAENDFINAYTYLKDALLLLKGKVTHNGALCNYLNGKEYYEASFRSQNGTDISILELEDYFKAKLRTLIKRYVFSFNKYNEKLALNLMDGLELDGLIEFFKTSMEESFPPINVLIEYEVKEMAKHLHDSQAMASYLISPIDANIKETVYLNPNYVSELNNTLYRVVGHESYPGHLYQMVYFKNTNAHDVRKVMHYLGYIEGWATYIENEVVGFIDEDAKKAFEFNDISGALITCLLDIGIHYHGWSLDEAYEFIQKYAVYEKEDFEEIYNQILKIPLIYLTYFYGYFQIQDLKIDFKKRLEDKYSDLAFHKAYLDTGPAPFSILKEELEKYN
ncbi:MAG: DUF885 family protein [Bacilli bacterium]